MGYALVRGIVHGIVILFRDGIPQFRWWFKQKRSKDAGPEWDSETLGFGNRKRDEPYSGGS